MIDPLDLVILRAREVCETPVGVSSKDMIRALLKLQDALEALEALDATDTSERREKDNC